MKKRLVLFDFDGTITTKDTLFEFIKFYHGPVKFYAGMFILSPVLVLFILKLIPNWKAKEAVLRWFFSGEDLDNFNARSREFGDTVVPTLVRGKAMEEIAKHLRENAQVAVISASAENWVQPWCARHGLNCLATHLEVNNNKLTGRIQGVNCYGAEKSKRIMACYQLEDFDEVFAYGDSRGDTEMLAMAHKPFYKPFRS